MPPRSPADQKKSKKKAERAISEAEFVELFLGTELLKDLPEGLLNDLARGKAQLREVGPGDEVLRLQAGRADKSPLIVLLAGVLRLKTVPQGEGAGDIVNVFLPDDVFFDKAYDPEGQQDLLLQAIQPTRLLQFEYADANTVLRTEPSFKERFMEVLKRGTERKKDFFDDPELRPVAEHLASEGLVGLGRLKVKRIDKCIDCDACFEACAERRGVCRLGDYVSRFDRIGVPQNCHSCTNPACQAACRFGHIRLTAGELQISDDCAGCTQCKKACPYGAINMIPLDSIPDGFLERSRNAKGKQIAIKCDDCIDYADQACISACPTGSLFQLASKSFQDYMALFAVKGGRGLEKLDQGLIEVEKPPWIGWRFLFIGGLLLSTLLVGYESIGRMYLHKSPVETIVDALEEAGLPEEEAAEVVERNIGPSADYQGAELYHALRRTLKPFTEAGVPAQQAREVQQKLREREKPPWETDWRTRYFSLSATLYHLGLRDIPPAGPHRMRPGNTLSLLLGYLGAFAMLLSQLYRVRRAVGSRMGNMRTWLEFHIYTGYLGGMLIFFHATYMFHGYVFWFCFVPMVIAILTGVLGRYVYFLIPRSEAGRAMDSTEINNRMRELNRRIEELVQGCPGGSKALNELKKRDLLALPVAEEAEVAWWKTLLGSFLGGFRQRARTRQLIRQLQGLARAEGKAKKELASLVDSRGVLEAAARRLKSLEVLTGSWRWIHVAASYLMFVAMLVHTVYAWIFLGSKAFIVR